MVGRGRLVVFPVIPAPWIFSVHTERGSSSAVVLFAQRCMDGKVGGDRCIFNTYPLVAVTELHISIVLNSGDGRIKNILVQYILGIMRLLLCECPNKGY